MDRTSDFLRLVDVPVLTKINPPLTNSQTTPFVQRVQQIRTENEELNRALDTLESLAKYKTLFDDKSSEVDRLANRIKSGLTRVSGSIEKLEADSSEYSGSHDANAHMETVVASLRNQTMSLTKRFTDALQTRRHTLETIEKRRGLYGQGTQIDLEAQEDMFDGPEQEQVLVANSNIYQQSRTDAVEQVQRMIGEVSTMFTRIAGIVNQQEEMVLRIDATVDDSLTRLREGQAHLLKYFNSIASNRTLILKLLGMLTIFAVFFIVILA